MVFVKFFIWIYHLHLEIRPSQCHNVSSPDKQDTELERAHLYHLSQKDLRQRRRVNQLTPSIRASSLLEFTFQVDRLQKKEILPTETGLSREHMHKWLYMNIASERQNCPRLCFFRCVSITLVVKKDNWKSANMVLIVEVCMGCVIPFIPQKKFTELGIILTNFRWKRAISNLPRVTRPEG